jgi:glycosyltransferase involved in cell wall biosynthesis
MGRNAAEYAQKYDWGKIAKQIVGVYTELIGNAK